MTTEHVRPGRFRHLLEQSGTSAPWDRVLVETDDFIVAPTLGSIVPGWMLVVPKRPAINFLEVADSGEQRPHEYLLQAAKVLELSNGWIWFEHGPAVEGSLVGCGVDYAHLHIIAAPPFGFAEFTAEISAAGDWEPCAVEDAYSGLPNETPYYVAGSGAEALRMVGRELGSQFFRKAVASLTGDQNRWDYRAHDFQENVLITLDRFGPLPMAAE